MRTILVVLWLLVLIAPAVAGAQEEAEPSGDEPFLETVDVNVVNVEVFVTDKQGNPVTDLTAADFEVFEDRRPVAVTNFYAVEDSRRVLPEPDDVVGEAGPEPGPTEEPGALPPEQRLFLIVYVDNFNIRPFNRNRVFRRLREFLHDHVDAADQIMLVSYDRSLTIRHPFTSEPGAISRALFELEELTGHALSRDSERRDVLEAIDEAKEVFEVEWRVRQYAEELYNGLTFTIDTLRDFVGTIAGLEGRKAILYVSDGLAMTAGEDMYVALQQKFVESGVLSRMHDFNALRQFNALTAAAASSRVSFYTLDAAGLRTSSSITAASRGVETPGLMALVDSTHTNNLQAPLRLMAEQTGGIAILNNNDPGPGLERMASDFETFYSLGYSPGHAGDGRFHRIEVRVKDGKGLNIRHRNGYRSRSIYSRMVDGTNASLVYGFENNPMSVNLRAGSGRRQEDGLFLVPVVVDIPIGAVEMVPQGEYHVGRVKLYFSVLDDESRKSDVQEVPLPLRIPSAEMEVAVNHPYVFGVELQMRGGNQRIAVGVRDEIGAVESFVVRTVRIGQS